MVWIPYIFGTRITALVKCPDPLGMAREVIGVRGPVVISERPVELRFMTPWRSFLIQGPYTLVTVTRVRLQSLQGVDRLVYDLHHPLDVFISIALIVLRHDIQALPDGLVMVLVIFAPLHCVINWFMHRDIVRQIATGSDRGRILLKDAR